MLLSRTAGVLESAVVAAAKLKNQYPPLFVVGAPRSGTTVVIQHLINSLVFAYFPNLAKEHPKACITYGWWARKRYRFEPSYDSAYGVIHGAAAPSDGWEIYHRWFPRYELDQPVRENRLHELRTIVRAYESIFGAPFANKNNANSVRIAHLLWLFPDARFIHVSRDMGDTVTSVLKSRVAHDVPATEWWGVAPPQFHDQTFETELERVVYQTWGVEQSITQALRGVPDNQKFTIRYEDFCHRPAALIEWALSTYAAAGVTLQHRTGSAPLAFPASAGEETDHESRSAEIERIVNKLEARDQHDTNPG